MISRKMKLERNLFAFIFIISTFKVLDADPVVVPPLLDVYQNQITVEEGQRLNIMCRGIAPLSWTVPESRYQSSPLTSRMSVNQTEAMSTGRTWYFSVLTVPIMEYMDTGYYNCSYTDGLNQPPDMVYVFVPNEENLFLKVDRNAGNPKFVWKPVSQGRPTYIPCRVSDPTANVILKNDMTGKIYDYTGDLSFDPKNGVLITYPTPQFNGEFACIATTENSTDTFKAILSYQPNTIPPQPVLETSSGDDGYVLVGDRLEIRCYVDAVRGVAAHIDFRHPVDTSRVVLSDPMVTPIVHNGQTYERHERTLTVSSMQVNDGGMYSCIAKHHDTENSRALAIYVHEKPFIWLLPSQTDIETYIDAKHVDLSVTVEAYPDPRISWYKDGSLITEDNRRFEIKVRPDRTRLRIHNVMMSDSGEYTLKASNKGGDYETVIRLHVLTPPTVLLTLPENHPFYIENQFYSLISDYGGTPVPTVSWEWQGCASPGCLPDDSQWKSPLASYNLPNEDTSDGVSTLKLQASETGFYRFKAINKLGTNFSEPLHFIVTDIPGGFGHYYADMDTQGEYLRPVVGDKVIVICKASPYAYLPPKMYNEREGKDVVMLNNSRWNMVEDKTSLAHILLLTFNSVDARDDGWYKCKTTGFLNDQHVSVFHLETRVAKGPVFTKPLEGKMQLVAGVDHTMECDAKGDPLPTISWTRDGQPLVNNDKKPILDHLVFNHNFTRLTVKEITLNDSGVYSCLAANRVGNIKSNVTLYITDTMGIHDGRDLSKADIGIIVGILLAGVILAVIVLVILVLRKRRKPITYDAMLVEYLQPQATAKYNPDLPIDEQTECLAYDPRWEIPYSHLKFDIILGQGAFGKVMRADYGSPKQPESCIPVAVKMVKDAGDREQLKSLLSELKVLIHIGQHVNLVNLVGAVTTQLEKGHLHVVVEYCRFGNLRQYLTKKRGNFVDTMDDSVKQSALNALAKRLEAEELLIPPPEEDEGMLNSSDDNDSNEPVVTIRKKPNYPKPYRGPSLNYPSMMSSDGGSTSAPTTMTYLNTGATGASGVSYSSRFSCDEEIPLTTKDLVCYAFQVARGMEYLTSKKYIHRDLAARNILLADDNVVKICDFGLAKDCYKYDEYKKKSDGPVPVRWMAIESLTHKVYTTKSDVWSYGILLWEIFSLGGTPYPAIDMDETFVNRLRQGYRLEKPKYATDEIYHWMQQCWKKEPEDRPHFAEISESVGDFLQENVKQFYMDLSTMYSKIQSGEDYVNMRGSEYLPMVPSEDEEEDDDAQGATAAAAASAAAKPATTKVQLSPRKGNAYYNSARLAPKNNTKDEQQPLMAKVDTVDERQTSRPNGDAAAPLMVSRQKQQPTTAKLGQNGSGDHSVKSNASSGFHSDYHSDDVAVPPRYSTVQQDSQQNHHRV